VRELTQRELNRALLARQLLLERRPARVVAAVERVAGLQAQDARAPYIGLWARLDGVTPLDLTRPLERRTLVKGTLMRGTLHIVTARDYAAFAPALRPMIRELWRGYLRNREVVGDVEKLAARAADFAAVPRTSAELRDLLGEDGWWRVRRHTSFVHVPTGRPWAFARRPSLVVTDAWVRRPEGDEDAGVIRLARRYLAAFGPAGVDDVAAWSGLPVGRLRPALERMRLRRFRDERGRTLFDLPGAPLPDPETRAPPRLLPPFDNAILSHADRTRVISDEHRPRVIRSGMVYPVFLVDGCIAGRWRLERSRVVLDPFVRLSAAARRGLGDEADRLASFLEP
jgi:Winged helix DNA-binding domain